VREPKLAIHCETRLPMLVQGDQSLVVDLIATSKALGGGRETPGAQGAAQ
jgi:hypothetical protein